MTEYEAWSPDHLKERIRAPERRRLVDVRDLDEFAALHVEGAVQTQVGSDLGYDFRRHAVQRLLTDHGHSQIARQYLDHNKTQQRDPQDHGHQQNETAEDILSQDASFG